MTTAITLYQSSMFGELTEADAKTIHETIAAGTTEAQFRLFMSIAKVMDANPLRGEIHPSVFNNKLSVQYGIDYYIRKAKETNSYRGYDVQLVHEHDVYSVKRKRADDGRYYDEIVHEWEGNRGKVVRGYALAYKEGFVPFMIEMDVEEVDHWKNSAIGMQKTMWTKQFNDMFKKHMVKRVLKAAFNELNEDEELDGGNGTPAAEPYQRKDITAESVETPTQPEAPKEKAQPKQPEVDPIAEQWSLVKSSLEKLGITEKSQQAEYINANLKIKGEAATVAEIKGLLKVIKLAIAEKNDGLGDLE